MEMSRKHREATGAFYTPKVWADLAVQYILSVIPNPEDYIFYDPAAGEGALLDALPANCTKIASTLEAEDVEILKAKGYENAFQFDFLDDSLNAESLRNNPERECLALAIENPEKLIIFTNPPYNYLPATNCCFAKKEYKDNNATNLFYYRIINEINPLMLCGFNKMDIWQGIKSEKFRSHFDVFEQLVIGVTKQWLYSGRIVQDLNLYKDYFKSIGNINSYNQIARLQRKISFKYAKIESFEVDWEYGQTYNDALGCGLFMCPSSTWPGLSSGWAIAFNVFWCNVVFKEKFPNNYIDCLALNCATNWIDAEPWGNRYVVASCYEHPPPNSN